MQTWDMAMEGLKHCAWLDIPQSCGRVPWTSQHLIDYHDHHDADADADDTMLWWRPQVISLIIAAENFVVVSSDDDDDNVDAVFVLTWLSEPGKRQQDV